MAKPLISSSSCGFKLRLPCSCFLSALTQFQVESLQYFTKPFLNSRHSGHFSFSLLPSVTKPLASGFYLLRYCIQSAKALVHFVAVTKYLN